MMPVAGVFAACVAHAPTESSGSGSGSSAASIGPLALALCTSGSPGGTCPVNDVLIDAPLAALLVFTATPGASGLALANAQIDVGSDGVDLEGGRFVAATSDANPCASDDAIAELPTVNSQSDATLPDVTLSTSVDKVCFVYDAIGAYRP